MHHRISFNFNIYLMHIRNLFRLSRLPCDISAFILLQIQFRYSRLDRHAGNYSGAIVKAHPDAGLVMVLN